MYQEIQKISVIHQSGYTPKWQGVIAPLRKCHYYSLDIPISGDAPRYLIRVYEYGAGRKKKCIKNLSIKLLLWGVANMKNRTSNIHKTVNRSSVPLLEAKPLLADALFIALVVMNSQ